MAQYVFPDEFAQSVLNAARDGIDMFNMPGFCKSSERQTAYPTEELKGLFLRRNSAGQTLLYCLLRYAKDPMVRDKILYAASKDQLVAQNSNCRSTALMGYFWGELNAPRWVGELWEGETPVSKTPVSDVFNHLNLHPDQWKIENIHRETALYFAQVVALTRPADYDNLADSVRRFSEKC